MVFADNFVEPIAGWLIDPVLKIRLATGAHKEAIAFEETDVFVSYDPEIRPEKLTMAPPQRIRKMRLESKSRAHSADDPLIFSSNSSRRVTKFYLSWDQPEEVLRLKDANDFEFLMMRKEALRNEGLPLISDHPEAFLFYMTQSITKFSEMRSKNLSETYPHVKRIEVCITRESARDFYRLSPEQMDEVEPDWIRVGSRNPVIPGNSGG